jgi:hypothetical protein
VKEDIDINEGFLLIIGELMDAQTLANHSRQKHIQRSTQKLETVKSMIDEQIEDIENEVEEL